VFPALPEEKSLNTNLHRGFGNRVREGLEKHPVRPLLVLYGICVAVFLIAVPLPRVDGQLVGSDGVHYYAYLPALLIAHDLSPANQSSPMPPATESGVHSANRKAPGPTAYAVGCAVLWLPFWLIGHWIAAALNVAGFAIARDGIGYVYQIPVLLGSLSYGFAGILLVYRACCRYFSRSGSATAAILIWLSTNLIYYMIAEPSMSHACSFFAVALFLELWLRYRPAPALMQWIFIGMAGGLLALVRLQDGTWLALPFLDTLLNWRAVKKTGIRRQIAGFFCFATAALIVFIPQLMVWHVRNKSYVAVGYPHSGRFFRWLKPDVLQILFSLRHGLYTWHPVLLLATAGLFLLFRRDRTLSVLMGLMLAAQVYLISAWHGWWGGDSFGGRMLICTFPALAFGLAALVDWAAEHKALPMACLLACCLIAWNALFFVQYRFGYISLHNAITIREMFLGKAAMLKDIAAHLSGMLR
jgi:hypothetical protein